MKTFTVIVDGSLAGWDEFKVKTTSLRKAVELAKKQAQGLRFRVFQGGYGLDSGWIQQT